jgi:integrase/recombinase XerD
MITIKLVYDRKKKATKTIPGTIEVRVTADRQVSHYSTGIRVLPQEWRNGMVLNRPDSLELNERLRIILRRVQAFLNDVVDNHTIFDSKALRNEIWPAVSQQNTSTDMLDWLTKQVDALTLAEGTKKHYRTLIMRLNEYGRLSSWRDLTVEGLYDLDSWLHKLGAQDGSGPISDAAVYNYHKCLKALLNRALAIGKIQANPYDRLKGQFRRGEKENIEYLTEAEMLRLQNLTLPADSLLDKARDLFVFQMYTGLAFSDTMAFDISRYRQDGDKWIATGERIKTGTPYVSQLLPPVVEVLQKYKYHLPQLDNADYNRALKLIGEAAGITIRMHSHLARHTFATWMIRQGVPIEHVTKMLGHTNITQTQRYAKIVAEDIHNDFKRVAEKLKS